MQIASLCSALETLKTAPAPRCAVHFVIAASRTYIANRVTGVPARPWSDVPPTFLAEWRVLDALSNVWDNVLASTHEPLILHDVSCPCVSLHERAVLMGVRSLQGNERSRFEMAMVAILPSGGVRLIEPSMQQLADTIYRLEQQPLRADTRASTDNESRMPHTQRYLH